MSARNLNKLIRKIDTYLTENPDLFDYSEYDDPSDVIVRLDETFGDKYRLDNTLCPDGAITVHEALTAFLNQNWNLLDDRITEAGGNSFENRVSVIADDPIETSYDDMMMAPYHRMTDSTYRSKREHLIEQYPYWVDDLSFGFCAENGETRSIEISLDLDKLYVSTKNGFKGLFAYDIGEKIKRYRILDIECFSRKINGLNIYKLPKAIPSDYKPEKHFMGCSAGTWYLSYKELGKKTTRHIQGKGSFPDSSPYIDLLRILNKVHPDQNLMEWVLSFK